MFYTFLILCYGSLIESYKIKGHAEIKAGGDKMIKFLDEYGKNIVINYQNIRSFWNMIKNAEVEIGSEPFQTEDSKESRWLDNLLSKADRQSKHYPENYPKLSAFSITEIKGPLDNKKRFLEFAYAVAPVYKMLISSLNVDYVEKYGKPYPVMMMAHDFIQIADNFKVTILSNGGRTYNLPWKQLRNGNKI